MMNRSKLYCGYTVIEAIVSIAILSIILLIGVYSIQQSNTSKQLEIEGNKIVTRLDEARTNSITGKYGQSFGVKFNSYSYVVFEGSTFIPTKSTNITYQLDDKYELSNNIPGSDDAIIFNRINGDSNYQATIVLFETNNSEKEVRIIIGAGGDINMIK